MSIELDIKDLLTKTVRVWDEIGFDQNYRKSLCDLAQLQVLNIYTDLLKGEEKKKDDIVKEIINGLETLCTMTTELGETVKECHQTLASLNLLQRSQYIESELSKLRKRIQDRMIIIDDLESKIDELSQEMEMKSNLHSHDDTMHNDYSMERISSVQKILNTTKIQRDTQFNSIRELSIEILELWEELRFSPETEFEQSILLMTQVDSLDVKSPISLSLGTLTTLEQKRDKLIVIKNEHEIIVKEYATKITSLWDKLEVPEDERESFFSKTAGLGYDVIEACEEELQRVSDLRKATLSQYINRAVSRIHVIYAQLHLPLDQLNEIYENHNCEEESEELLEVYEREVERVEEILEVSKPLLALIEKREQIRNDKIEYEQTVIGDKERLLSKKFDRGRFIQEEKLRKTFQKLPQIEETLKKQLHQWHQSRGTPFCYEGFPYLELMHQQYEHEKKLKESEKIRKDREKLLQNHKQSTTSNGSNSQNNSNNNNSHKTSTSSSTSGNKTPQKKLQQQTTTPSTPKTPTSRIQMLKQQELLSSPYGKMIQNTANKKRFPLSPINNNSPRAVKKLKQPIISELTHLKTQTSSSALKKKQNKENNINQFNQIHSVHTNSNLKKPMPSQLSINSTSSVHSNFSSTSGSSSSSSSGNTSPLQQPIFNSALKSSHHHNYDNEHNESIVSNHQYDDDLIMNDKVADTTMQLQL
ncbi:hypothetical protein DLAC_05554 [Tieghemostelium lacteum]|uniref:Microtubule-associated protein n=1 Tax=Tieghemostelium lacteum TaxID=361077 RepID=A0A151ZGG2_TIELA|nr:hypothetical protein DLAC_05554 [Tieghemostelium lacteum]|eukprot:KYQ92954.1 hypothetical protein DLAC_05554 [Tieghemostelium lacteum]